MFVAHTIALSGQDETLANGRSSILFATLAGVSLGLVSGGAHPLTENRARLRAALTLRASLLIMLGLLLWALDTYVAVILDYYGVMFVLMLPLLFLPRRALAVLAIGIAVIMPFIVGALQDAYPDGEGVPFGLLLPALWLAVGYYPALTWLAFLLAGLLCARSGLTRPRTQLAMVLFGSAAMLIGYGSAALSPRISAAAHDGTTAEVLGSGGFAIAVLGALLYLTGNQTGVVGKGVRALFWPIGAIGAMPLTIYTLQIIAIFILTDLLSVEVLLIVLLALGIGFASVWRPLFGSGPLERLVRWLSEMGTRRTERRLGQP